jgi:hypothetical protein
MRWWSWKRDGSSITHNCGFPMPQPSRNRQKAWEQNFMINSFLRKRMIEWTRIVHKLRFWVRFRACRLIARLHPQIKPHQQCTDVAARECSMCIPPCCPPVHSMYLHWRSDITIFCLRSWLAVQLSYNEVASKCFPLAEQTLRDNLHTWYVVSSEYHGVLFSTL